MRTIFWNVDTQYDFMREDGALPVKDAKKIESNLEALTRIAEYRGIKVVNTADWHNEYTKEISGKPDFRTTFPNHCMQKTRGAEYVPATQPKYPYVIDWQEEGFDPEQVLENRNVILYKDDFDIFKGNKHAEEVLKLIKPERAIVYGVATNVCVDFAVRGLLARGIQVYVPTDAIKELPGLPLEETLKEWKEAGAKLIKIEDVARCF